ncbi:hypothetical protein LguiA_021913 [Lonicera macranthoides]
MEWVWMLAMWSIIMLSPTFLLLCYRRRSKRSKRPPPGPWGWPVFGHIFSLGTMPHRTMAALKQQYGPIIWLKLASVDTAVIQSAEAAAELFKNHDITFANRSSTHALQSHLYNQTSVSMVPYGPFWRLLRRICTVQIFESKRLTKMAPIRQKCVNELLVRIGKEIGKEASGIDVRVLTFLTLFNMIGNLMLSRDLVDSESKVGSEFFMAVMEMLESIAAPNISDLFPQLRRLDLQGIRKKMDRDLSKALEVASGLVKQRIKERENRGEKNNDFLDVLLDFEGSGNDDEPAKLSEHVINVFVMDMFIGGTETTSSTVEWALTELIRKPSTMEKVKEELLNIVGINKKLEDSEIDNLHYLHAVIKETLRLHPPAPFLLPRRASQDVNLMGYHIPKNTQVFVNVWAIGRDPKSWDDPLSFKPERFLGSKIDFRGQHFEFIPFGAGRRICPALRLANRTLALVLGSLLHEFDWELDSQVAIEEIDMKEKMGLTLRKLVPLKVIANRRRI